MTQVLVYGTANNGRSDLLETILADVNLNGSSGSTGGSTGSSGGRYSSEDLSSVENEMTGLDLVTGILVEPTVEFFTFIIDGIMSVFSGLMRQEEIQFVMVKKDELPPAEDGTLFSLTEEDLEKYKTASGGIDRLRYPNFTYTPEEIFTGNISLLDINFIKDNPDNDDNWQKIRTIVSQWYQVLRMIAIIGLLSVLIYTGIKIIISSTTKDKAKYKEMIVNWFIAVLLAFSMHYIMAFILSIIEQVLGLISGLTGVIKVEGPEGINFSTNLMGLARFQMQKQHFSDKIGHLVIYTALVVYTFKFTFLYFKRVLRMAFLTIISPIVALTYPIDKMEGQAKGFQMWLKEYTYNALLQPMHYILYYILVSSSLSLAAHNPIYGIAALMFISQAENLLKRIFGFDKARAGTVQGLTGAFATGAITSSLNKYVKDPMHPFGLGKGNSGSGKSSGSGKGSSRSQQLTNGNYMDSEKVNYKEDVVGDDALLQALGIESGANSEQQTTPNPSVEGSTTMAAAVIGASTESESLENIPEISQMPELAQLLAFMESSGMVNTPEERNAVISEYLSQQNGSPLVSYFDKFFTRYRKQLPISVSELGGLSYDTDETGSFENILGMLADYKRTGKNSGAIPLLKNLSYEQLKNLLRSRIDENESEFIENNIPLQYVDGDSRTSSQLLEEIMRLNELSTDISLPSNERNKYAKQSQKLLKKLKRRMAQNEYIKRNGGVLKLRKQEADRISDLVTSYQLSDIDIIGVFNPDMLINGIPITEYIALKNEYKQKQAQVIKEDKKENKTKVELGSKEQIVQNEQQVQAEIISEQKENEYGVIEQPKLRNIFGLKRGRIQTKPRLVQDPIERAGLKPQKLGKDVDSKLVIGEEELSQRTIPGLGHRRISGLKRNMLQMLNGTIIQSPEERAGQANQQEQGRYETTEEIPTNEIGRGLILGTTSGLGKRTLLRMRRKLVKEPERNLIQEQNGTIIQTPEERLKQAIDSNSNQGAADGYAIDNGPIMLPRRRVRREKTLKDLKRGLINQYERKQLQEPRGKLIGGPEGRIVQNPEERNSQQQPKGRLAQELENRKVQELKRSLYQSNGNISTDTGVEENKKPTIAQILEQKQKHKEERKQKREQSWKEFNEKPITKGVKNVVSDMRKGAIKPLWDEEKDVEYNVERLAGNVIKGVAGATLGIAAAAVQAGISITDGKYSIKEGMATFGAGMAGASNIVNASGRKLDELRRDQYSLERYSHEWYNRDDIISEYNREYPGQGKAMRRRAVNNYVSRGVTDVKEQKQAMKFAELLKKERGLNEEEADKIAVATLQYKKGLTRNSDYMVLFDEKRRDKYLDTKVDAYSGAASKDAIRRLHLDLIENVRDFDKVNE